MLQKLIPAILLFLGIESLASAAQSCVSQMMTCTQEMRQELVVLDNKTSLCGVMDAYMGCLETSCNNTLTPCDLSDAKNIIDEALREYDIQCDTTVPAYVDMCNFAPTVSSTWTVLVILHVVFAYGSIYCQRHQWRII